MGATLRAALAPGPSDRHGPLVGMLVALTLLTGVVDAVSYLRLGHVFVANMTGNVVFLGFALAGAGGVSIASSLIALGAFLIGAQAGGRIGASLGRHRGHLVRAATTVQAMLIATALVVALASSASEPDGVRYAITAVLAVAMGIQNALASRIAVPELTTTVLTKTLTGLASEAGRDIAMSTRRVAAIVAMIVGALAGGLLALEVSVAAGLTLALALACTVALAAHLTSRGAPVWAADK